MNVERLALERSVLIAVAEARGGFALLKPRLKGEKLGGTFQGLFNKP